MTAPALPGPVRRARLGTQARLGLALLAVAALAAVAMAFAHPQGATHPRVSAQPIDPNAPIHGQTLQQARCTDWLAATPAEKAAAVGSLSAIVGAPTEYKGVRGTALTAAQSYRLLDNACASPIARHFLLYELYIRAAAFSGLAAGP